VLSRTPQPLALEPVPTGQRDVNPTSYLQRWKSWLQTLLENARTELAKSQEKYRNNFDERLRRQKDNLKPGGYVFVRKERFQDEEKKHKLSSVADGPYKIEHVDPYTVTLKIGQTLEKISRDRVVEAPTGDQPQNDIHPTVNPRIQQGEPTTQASQYVIDKIVSYGLDEQDNYMFRIRWYGYTMKHDTWEYPENLPRSAIVTFLLRSKVEIPTEVLDKCQVG